jgi:hypothetical protein
VSRGLCYASHSSHSHLPSALRPRWSTLPATAGTPTFSSPSFLLLPYSGNCQQRRRRGIDRRGFPPYSFYQSRSNRDASHMDARRVAFSCRSRLTDSTHLASAQPDLPGEERNAAVAEPRRGGAVSRLGGGAVSWFGVSCSAGQLRESLACLRHPSPTPPDSASGGETLGSLTLPEVAAGVGEALVSRHSFGWPLTIAMGASVHRSCIPLADLSLASVSPRSGEAVGAVRLLAQGRRQNRSIPASSQSLDWLSKSGPLGSSGLAFPRPNQAGRPQRHPLAVAPIPAFPLTPR